VTAVPAFAVRHVVPALSEFYQKYPKIRVKISCSNRTLDLGDGGFDLGIRVSFNPAPNLVARKLAANRSVLCASPAYLERHGTPRRIEDLDKHRSVLFPAVAPKGIWTFRRHKRKYAVRVAPAFETDDMDAVRAAILAGLGVGALPAYIVGDALRQGLLVPLLRQFQILPESGIYLVYLPNRTLPSRVRALIDFLTAWFGPVPSWDVGW
jgi:DNA-binding transcriptional LysR family regulator